MDAALLETVVTLRIAVGSLGERGQHDWWPTNFFADYGAAFLNPVYPKTAGLARMLGTNTAATMVHDAAIGVGNTFHLFRLPESWEYAISRYSRDNEINALVTKVAAGSLATLTTIAGLAEPPVSSERGPIRVASASQMQQPRTWSAFAGHYLAGFNGGYRLFPFISATV